MRPAQPAFLGSWCGSRAAGGRRHLPRSM